MAIKIKSAIVTKITQDSYFFRIPKQYINNSIINKTKKYDLEVKEVVNNEN